MARVAQLRKRFSGAATVSVGLGLLGLSAYALLALAGHALEPDEFTSVASLYFLSAIVGPGIFVAIEQETNREISSRVAAGVGTGPVGRAASAVSAALAAVVCVALLAASPFLVGPVFRGSWTMMAAVFVAVAGAAAVYVLRGRFAGERRYGWYSATLALEGLARLVPCIVLAVVGMGSATTFGFAFALGAVVAAAITAFGIRPGGAGPAVSVPGMARSAGLLAGASGLTLLVANLAPVVLTSRLVEDPRTAATFASVFVLARIPLFLFAPVQAFLLPSLTAAAAGRDAAGLRRRVRAVIVAVAAVGIPGAAVAALFGPWFAQVFFDAPTLVPGWVAGVLALSTLAMMAAQVMQPALVALGLHRMTTAAWTAGTVVFVALLFLPGDAVAAAVTAQLAAPLVVVAVMTYALRHGLRALAVSGPAPSTPVSA